MRRIALLFLGIAAVTLGIAFVALVLLAGSDFGRERVRQAALGALRGIVRGEIAIGRIEGNLLDRFSLVDVTIADEQGRPFLAAGRVTGRIALAPLVSKRILIPELTLENPVITLSKSSNGTWNYARIFPRDTSQADTTLGFGSWVELRDVGVRHGTLIVHQPFPTDEGMTAATRDSLIRAALAGDTRLRIERVDGGLRQTMDFRRIEASLPRLIVAHPDSDIITLRVARLSMLAAPFRPPELAVRDLRGDVRIGDDTMTLENVTLRLPDSRLTGNITYHVAAGDVDMSLRSDTLAFADLRALYPPLPDRGGGRLDLEAAIRNTEPSVVEISNARVRVGESRAVGRLGLVLGPDTLHLSNADLSFTRFSTALVERLVPGLAIRLPGAFTGRARVEGPLAAMRIDVDGRFDPARHAAFRVAARGLVGAGDVVRAERLRLTVNGLPVSVAREFGRELPVGGTLGADATVNGSSDTRLTGTVTITHRQPDAVSRVVAEGTVIPGDSMRMMVDVRLAPVSMEVAQAFLTGTDLRGSVTGTGRIRGTPRRLSANLTLALPAGAIDIDGEFDRTTASPSYDATVELRDVDPSALAPSLPAMALRGRASVVGRGVDAATMNTRATLRLRDLVVDSAQVAELVLVGGARDARLVVDTLRLRAPFGAATAAGTLGLTEGTEGTLEYRVDIGTLAGLQRWIATGDTGLVYPRPAVRQRLAINAARADSIRQAELVRSGALDSLIARGEAWLQRAAQIEAQVTPLGRDSIAGTVRLRGTLAGRVQQFTARARAAMSGVVWGGNEVGRGTVDVLWADVRTPGAELQTELGVDSLRVAGFAFDSTHVQGTYRNGSGGVVLAVYPGDTAAYQLRAEYALRTGEGEVRVQDVSLRFDSVTWISTAPSTIRWRGRGIAIDSLSLAARDHEGRSRPGRIFVNGEMPDEDPGRLEIVIDSASIAPWLTLAQSTLSANGVAGIRVTLEGTRSAPRLRGSIALVDATYAGTPFPELRTEFEYAERRLRLEGDMRRSSPETLVLARFGGSVPLDLTFGDSVADRLAPGALDVTVEGDSIPLGPVAEFVDALSVVEGDARGRVAVGGTWERPQFEGGLALDVPRVGIAATGVTLSGTTARLRMTGNRLVIDTLVARSGGTLRGRGEIRLADVRRPVFDVRITADTLRVLNNDMGQLVVHSRLGVRGPIDTLSIGGSVTVANGVIYIPDPAEQNLINTGDPALFAVVDTATARELEVSPPSPLFENARMDVTLEVRRGTWARSSEANIEIYGALDIERAPGDEEIEVSGALYTDYGEYAVYGRRFAVSRGSVRFTGPIDNPVLQILATHEVRQAGRAPFEIQVTVGGTLREPNLSLDSNAQPTLTQSDLIAFLAFGRSSTSLLEFDGSGLEGGGMSGSSLAGNVASMATRQLAAVGLGALAEEAQRDLLELTAADVLEIRPAELPADLSIGAVGTALSGTEILIGKYLDPTTFLVAQLRPTAVPGATLEKRFGTQFSLRLSFETRYLPQRPTLTTGLEPQSLRVFGTLFRWTRGW